MRYIILPFVFFICITSCNAIDAFRGEAILGYRFGWTEDKVSEHSMKLLNEHIISVYGNSIRYILSTSPEHSLTIKGIIEFEFEEDSLGINRLNKVLYIIDMDNEWGSKEFNYEKEFSEMTQYISYLLNKNYEYLGIHSNSDFSFKVWKSSDVSTAIHMCVSMGNMAPLELSLYYMPILD